MSLTRRGFLRLSALAGASLMVPASLKAFAPATAASGKTLVILRLTGGNDGLNTLIPYRDDRYYAARPNIAIPRRDVLPLTGEAGLHPALAGLRQLYDSGHLAILSSVGYPHPIRSHHRSLAIWDTGLLTRGGPEVPAGWAAICGCPDESPLPAGASQHRSGYPPTSFGQQLQRIAARICSDTGTPVFTATLDGFDTHTDQADRHIRLLTRLDFALTAFVTDLQAARRFDDVLVMTVSEFGRRVAENGYGGTDHGAAGPMFLIGGGLRKAGLYHSMPDLTDLDEGDLKYRIDFRRAYATILDRWLGIPHRQVLGQSFEPLSFI